MAEAASPSKDRGNRIGTGFFTLEKENEIVEKVIIKVTGVLVDMLVELNPKLFASFVAKENNQVFWQEIKRPLAASKAKSELL